MFKKFFTLFIAMAIFTVQAHASAQDGLKKAFDEMNYALTVEWDQKDQSFYETELKKFTSVIRDLKKTGLSNEEMIEFAKSQVKDARVAKDLETAFSVITVNKMNSEEASKYMMDSMKRAYSDGASWSGGVTLYLVVGLLVLALAVAASPGTAYYGGGSRGCYDSCYYYDYQCGTDWFGWPVYCEGYTCDTVCY